MKTDKNGTWIENENEIREKLSNGYSLCIYVGNDLTWKKAELYNEETDDIIEVDLFSLSDMDIVPVPHSSDTTVQNEHIDYAERYTFRYSPKR